MRKKIVILTTGQPSTNPRMLKEYKSLKEEGYIVKVFYSYWADWGEKFDNSIFASKLFAREDFFLIGGSPKYKNLLFYYSRFRNKLRSTLGFGKDDYRVARTSYYLEKAVLAERADLYIGHNLGALPAAVKAAYKFNAKVGFDAEDYHRGEFYNQNEPGFLLAKRLEDKYIPQCNYITAASPLIAAAYQKLYPESHISVIRNVFSKKFLQSSNIEKTSALTLFWFSQTIGPNRGLETVVKAIETLKDKCKIELHLMGRVSVSYASSLLKLTSIPNAIYFIPPVSPDEIFAVASNFDVGLSIEVSYIENRDVCLTNKLFTYFLAGNCVVLSNTTAQISFAKAYPELALLFDGNNYIQLGEILLFLFINREKLNRFKKRSLHVASTILNWEYESQKFLNIIKDQLNCRGIEKSSYYLS